MATYQPGITDFIPQLQPFEPDLNFYGGALQEKQKQFDSGLNKINSLYGSVLNSPMIRTDNLERRNQYFKTIEQDLQKIARLDLSQDQNVQVASKIFDPILNDQYMIKDMVFTKQLNNAYLNSEQYRNCVDPAKCGGEFWEEGVQDLNFKAEEFKNASADESLYHQGPKYVPKQNVTKKAMEAAKAAGFNISYDSLSPDGRFIVKDSNGQMLLGPDGQGILPQYLYGMFGGDASVQAMYNVQASVARKSWAKANAIRYAGGEMEAEQVYLNNIISSTVPELEQSRYQYSQLKAQLDANAKSLKLVVDSQGGSVPGDGTENAFDSLMQMLDASEQTKAWHESTTNLIESAPNLNDVKAMRARADELVSRNLFRNEIDAAAYAYAMGTAKHDLQTNAYGLAAFNNQLDLNKALTLKKVDQQYWLQQNILKGEIDPRDVYGPDYDGPIPQALLDKRSEKGLQQNILKELAQEGITEKDLLDNGIRDLSKKSIEKIMTLKGVAPARAEVISNMTSIPEAAEATKSNWFEMSKLNADAANNLQRMSPEYAKSTIQQMQKAYSEADAVWGKDAVGVKTKLLLDLKDALNGTNIDYNAMMRGEVPLSVLDNVKGIQGISNTLETVQTKGVSARVYNSGWSDDKLAQYQMAKQTATGIYNNRVNELQTAVLKVKTTNDPIYNRLVDASIVKDAILPIGDARARFIQMNTKYFDEQVYTTEEGRQIVVTPEEQASRYFDSKHGEVVSRIDKNISSYNTPSTDQSSGGMDAVKNTIQTTADLSLPLNKNTRELKDVISAIKNNPDGNSFLFLQPGVQDISGQTTSSVRKELFNQISDIANEGGKAKIKMSVQYLPEWFDKTATASRSTFESNVVEFPGQTNMLSGDLHKEGVLIGFTLDEDAYREKNGLKKTDVVPEADRTVWVKAPATLSALSPALSKMYKSPEQLYMQKPGSQFSLDLGPKGSALIRRNSDGFLYVKPAPIVLDPVSGQVVSYKPVNGDAEWIKVTKPNGENVPVSINDSPGDVQDATGVILDYMNQAYQRTQQAIKYYNKTYARSNTNTQ